MSAPTVDPVERPPTALRRDTRPAMRRERRAALGFLAPNLLGFTVFTIVPIGASLVLAFYEWPLLGERVFVGLDNVVRMLTTDPVFWQIVGNTFYFVVGYVALNLLVSFSLALWLQSRVRFKGFYRFVFFLPVVSPMVANAMVWRMLYQRDDGLIAQLFQALTGTSGPNWLGDARWAMPAVILMSLWAGFGYNMIILVAGLQAIPASMTEAAQIDGAGWWSRLAHVTLPLVTPSLFFATVMTVISSLQVFAQPFILTGGGPGIATSTLVFYLYQWGFQSYEMGYASAIAWFLFMLIMTITFIQFRGQKKWVHY
ncbi:MAG: sugar ABC transporter permease [Salana multivorans]|uniref:carbohydrate ABC transporter permease n=1 Tax=Salana multivorans TaxID=120377 RepID=UPI000B155A46|nr:sugar ABC transporter permease [Salana multivorans]MBN8882322.1 sugar ABC transporter permease [Salana multivorans]